uniref:Phospholipid-transporting ATPase n=1 Tax=Chrysocystis fragilis TaxID=1411660 RepID=A0A7S0TB62_9STRA
MRPVSEAVLEAADEKPEGVVEAAKAAGEAAPAGEARRVVIGAPSPFCDNTVTSSKYTLVSFFPVALFGQFRRFANLYFLLGGLLMFFGEQTNYFLSPYQSSTTLGPLAVVICISLLQEALTDLARHRADAEVNMRDTDVLNPEPKTVPQKTLRTGQIVRVENGEMIPADLVILATSTEANTCYIDTASIDGETSLKIRRAPLVEDSPAWMREAAPKDENKLHAAMATLKGTIECDPPNEKISRFNGTLKLDGTASSVPLGKDHVVLRGSSLHTDWMLGVAVYTGQETKLALNARTPPQKLSRIDKTCNRVVIAIFACQVCLALVTTVIGNRWEADEFDKLWYIAFRDNKAERRSPFIDARWPDLEATSEQTNFGWGFCTFLILYVNFIPLSLYVSLELCFQALTFFVNWDLAMYHKDTNTPALARSPTVTDLGQVEYVFSDKTGTLTRNEMKLRRLIVHGVTYAVPEGPNEEAVRAANQLELAPGQYSQRAVTDTDVEPVATLAKRAVTAGDDFAALILESLMLCNTVVVETKRNAIKYQAESPDEGALVDGATVAGYRLSARTEHVICGETRAVGGARRTWQILATNEFDNDRKRMSIFVREQFDEDHAVQRDVRPLMSDTPSTRGAPAFDGGAGSSEGATSLRGRVLLLCKGADNAMFKVAADKGNAGIDDMRLKLDDFAREGLRTLVFGYRVYSEDEWQAWYENHYQPASVALQDRDALLTRASHAAETELTIIGASAIEDKLQIGVPETIATLAEAGIKLWVLTGDKRETAIEIGKSCKLLRPGMPLAVLSSKASAPELESALLHLYEMSGAAKLFANDKQHQALVGARLDVLRSTADEDYGDCRVWTPQELEAAVANGAPKALVIDGEAMANLFGDPALEAIVFGVLSTCGSVIACRVTPKQKAQLVKLVHQHVSPTPVTLAIGDGANDVNMIMSAQVGVGISGHEGLQAVNASDFAIAQFRFLERLLLVHGRWGYRRVAILVLYSFYKNACLAITLFLFCFFTGYSGTSLFSDYFTALFNFFLFLSIFYTSIFDQDVSVDYIRAHPQLYASGRDNLDLNVALALQWIFVALVHALIIFLLPAYALQFGTGSRYDLGAYQPFGAVVSCGFICYMNIKVLFETRYFTTLLSGYGKKGGGVGIFASTWFAAGFNFLFFYFGLITASYVGDDTSFIFQLLPFWNVGNVVLAQPSTWAITFLVIAACGAVDLLLYASYLFFAPDPIAVSVERCRLGLDKDDDERPSAAAIGPADPAAG